MKIWNKMKSLISKKNKINGLNLIQNKKGNKLSLFHNDKELILIEKNKNGLNINLNTDIMFSIDGEINGITTADINIDTLYDYNGGKLNLNGRWARQIRDLPKSIEWRKKQEQIVKNKVSEIEENAKPKKYVGEG